MISAPPFLCYPRFLHRRAHHAQPSHPHTQHIAHAQAGSRLQCSDINSAAYHVCPPLVIHYSGFSGRSLLVSFFSLSLALQPFPVNMSSSFYASLDNNFFLLLLFFFFFFWLLAFRFFAVRTLPPRRLDRSGPHECV